MSFTKGEDGSIVFECDECGDELDTRVENLGEALSVIRDACWSREQDRKGAWNHYCSTCRTDRAF
jgi:hypothetical protein